MKGQKQKDYLKYVGPTLGPNPKNKCLPLAFTYLDLVPIEFTRENVMKWLAESGWIEGLVIKYLGDQCPYLDDYIQEIYLLIFDKTDKLIEVYEDRGILAFCGYVKMIIFTNSFNESSIAFRNIRKWGTKYHLLCSDEVWSDIMENYDPDINEIYKFNRPNNIL